jgi:hypothetical protein
VIRFFRSPIHNPKNNTEHMSIELVLAKKASIAGHHAIESPVALPALKMTNLRCIPTGKDSE